MYDLFHKEKSKGSERNVRVISLFLQSLYIILISSTRNEDTLVLVLDLSSILDDKGSGAPCISIDASRYGGAFFCLT